MGALGDYNGVGLMAGPTAFGGLLDALAQEALADPGGAYGWPALHAQADALQRSRVRQFLALPFPFGSEMPWDSTAQGETFVFAQRYGADYAPASYRTANLTLAATKAYTPWDVPLWAYAGSSRRYWDTQINGLYVLGPTERALHHYGSGINARVLLDAYWLFPNDTTRTGCSPTTRSRCAPATPRRWARWP